MFESFLKKNFWQSLFTGTAGSGRTKFTFEELRALSDVLSKNQVVTEGNRALVVETIRSIAEFMIWGDQNEPRIFDYFLENNVMHYLHRVLQQPANRTGDVAKQVLQTLSIIIQNVRSETGTYFLFSNNHVNNIVEIRFDFEDEEVLGYYISFLKTISMKLNARTVQFFFDRRESEYTFPLYSEAVKFAHHKEGMVRAGVRTLTLNVYSVPDEYIQNFICRPPATAYFAEMVAYIADQIKTLDKRMAAAEGFNAQVLSSLDSQLAEVEDMMSYVADILTTAHPRLAHTVAEQLWVSLVGPYLLRPLLEYGSGKAVTHGNPGPRRTSAGGTAPASPGAASSPSIVRTACSLYCLERLFVLITYQPFLHNLALALLDPRVGHPSCRSALLTVLRSEDHRAVPMALRCLVAVIQSRRIAPELLALLGMVPRSRSTDLQIPASASDCSACRLCEELPPLPEGCPAAGAPPDPLAEEAQPVATVATGATSGSASVFAYHVLWTRFEGAQEEWVLAQQGFGDRHGQDGRSVTETSQGEATAADQAEPGVLGSEAEEGEAAAGEQALAETDAQELLGNHVGATVSGDAASSRSASLGPGRAALSTAQQDAGLLPLEYFAAEAASMGDAGPPTRSSEVDLLGLGDAAADMPSTQPVSADLLGLGDVLAPTAPAPATDAAGTRADAAGQAMSGAPFPPGTGGRGADGQIADLLDLDLETVDGAVSSVLLHSTILTPSASAGAALGPATLLGAASEHLRDRDSLLDPTFSGPQGDLGPSTPPADLGPSALSAGAGAAAQSAADGLREASHAATEAAPPAGTAAASGGAGTGTPQDAGALGLMLSVTGPQTGEAITDAVSAADSLTPGAAESLGALDVASDNAALGPQSTASSSAVASAGGESFSADMTPAGALGDASASNTPSPVPESSSPAPQQHRTTGADAEAAASAAGQEELEAGLGVAPPPPPAAPLPPPPAPAPPVLASPVCAAHARPATMSASNDLLDALFALLSMQLLPVQGLWHLGHLLQQLYPRATEQHELDEQLRQLPHSTEAVAEPAGQIVADLLNLDLSFGGAEPGAGAASGSSIAAAASSAGALEQPPPQPQPQSPSHPLDPSSTAGWACGLSSTQREALRVAAVSAASAVLDEVGGMWCDALVAMLVLEWPLAHDAVTRPPLRTGAEQLLSGPHLYPRQNARSLSGTSRNDQGLSGSAVAALHSYHAVSRLVALLLVHDLLCKGATERTPPPTVPAPAGADVDGREWDVLEGQEVELQAGSAIPCIVSFSPGQERRVYFAAAGPALRRVGEYLQNPQVLLSDPGSQSVVLHSSPAVVLAEPAPTRLNAGFVLSVSPLLGCDPSVDKNVPKWVHVHVRPSVRGLLRLLRSAAAGRKGGLLGALRHLVDGHWVLAFPDAERAANARQLVEQSAHRLRALYCELLSPVLSTVME